MIRSSDQAGRDSACTTESTTRATKPRVRRLQRASPLDKIAIPLFTPCPEGLHLAGNHGKKPGPGQYDPQLGSSFSLHQRTNDSRNKNPGPGAYDPYAYEQLPNFSLGERLQGCSDRKKPGPGRYDPKLDQASRAAACINERTIPETRTARLKLMTLTHMNGYQKISLGKRLSRMRKGHAPGPWQYDPQLGPGGPSFSLHQRTNDPRNNNSEPGAYNPYALECLQNFSIGERLTPDKRPGPGAYNTEAPGDGPAFTTGFRLERKRPPV